MNLITEARKFYLLYSVQITAALAFLAVLQANWDALGFLVPEEWKPYIVALFALASIAARLIPQPEVKEKAIVAQAVAEAKTNLDEQAAQKLQQIKKEAVVDAAAKKDE